jgi:hypothetical protein
VATFGHSTVLRVSAAFRVVPVQNLSQPNPLGLGDGSIICAEPFPALCTIVCVVMKYTQGVFFLGGGHTTCGRCMEVGK